MKVLVVSNMFPNKNNPSYGIFVSHFCEQLEQIGINYDKVVMSKPYGKAAKLLKYLIFYIITFLKYLFGDYDVVYIHYSSHSSAPIILANHIKKRKIVVNVHGSDVVPENDKQEKMQKYTGKILQVSSAVVAPSEYFRQYVNRKYRYTLDKIFIYPSAGINNTLFYQYTESQINSMFDKFCLPKGKIIVGFVGRITAGKGWKTFILAASKLRESMEQFEFVMVGSGSDEEMLSLLIKENRLDGCIRRFPLLNQSDLADMYNCFDIFVFPTEREGESLGLVAIEAMTCGTPVIASDFAAPKYYIRNGINGYKFEKGNVTALVKCLLHYSTIDKTTVELLKKNAIETSKYYYTENILENLQQIFKEIENEK